MWEIKNDLVVGVGVHSCHEAADNAEAFMKYFCHRSKAVGGTRRVGDDVVLCRVICRVINA